MLNTSELLCSVAVSLYLASFRLLNVYVKYYDADTLVGAVCGKMRRTWSSDSGLDMVRYMTRYMSTPASFCYDYQKCYDWRSGLKCQLVLLHNLAITYTACYKCVQIKLYYMHKIGGLKERIIDYFRLSFFLQKEQFQKETIYFQV